MKISEEKRYEHLSPFELKNKLIQMAGTHHERMMLNAGRGNPNWLATTPRQGFFQLGLFAIQESQREQLCPGFGGAPDKAGIAGRFEAFVEHNLATPGVPFLRDAFAFVRDEMRIDHNEFVSEMVDAILGDHYPEPDRMLRYSTMIVRRYLEQEICGGALPSGKLDLFATEGGTAAMAYIFNSLVENKLLHKGDKIALGTPIFTPYLEIPRLNDYEFVELEIEQAEGAGWQYADSEIEKLADPAVKAFFLVHPANPSSVSMKPDTLDRIGELVRTRRTDLIILTDDVYGTFVNGFRSLMAVAPLNTILVYSYSKYFGATGWRLGVIAIHQDSVFDKMIADLPAKDKDVLHRRYGSVALDPDRMKLIERMVADSRTVALHHTAGLSTPQQVMMVLFSLSCLIDRKGEYKSAAQDILLQRIKMLYDALGISHPANQYDTHYYTTIDIPALAQARYGSDFADYLVKNYEPIDFVIRLAEEKSIVLLDGGGFDAPNMSVRVSLANLPQGAYQTIGQGISDLLADYHQRWESSARGA
jgi:aspartate 4-decarboxylase